FTPTRAPARARASVDTMDIPAVVRTTVAARERMIRYDIISSVFFRVRSSLHTVLMVYAQGLTFQLSMRTCSLSKGTRWAIRTFRSGGHSRYSNSSDDSSVSDSE